MTISANRHPVPDFERLYWRSLDGPWEFEFDFNNVGMSEQWQKRTDFTKTIVVPYVYQCELSGINSEERCDVVWYKKSFFLNNEEGNKSCILCFGAVDFKCTVWVNGELCGEHTGGYSSFKIDISHLVKEGDNVIYIRVYDKYDDKRQPRGKQSWTDIKPFGCWYKGYTGIWQSVWLEFAKENFIEDLKIITDIDTGNVNLVYKLTGSDFTGITAQIRVTLNNNVISDVNINNLDSSNNCCVSVLDKKIPWNGLALWSPDTPFLYDLKIDIIKNGFIVDSVKSYFGMRKIEVNGNKVFLNGVPVYQKLILNQGYYPGGWITPDSDERYESDIKLIKEMGFNGMRIHEKIESPRFLYECDRLGLLVWAELPSAYEFDDESINYLMSEWLELIRRDRNHPCIITWVAFNESWGVRNLYSDKLQQELVQSFYHMAKALDPTRIVIANDGWEHTVTDICTIHDYAKDGEEISSIYNEKSIVLNSIPSRLFPRYTFAKGYKYSGQPVIISEFGGIALSKDEGWGYSGKVKDEAELLNRIESLMLAIKNLNYVCGYCFTQFTDVEDEQNGILSFERLPKVEINKIKSINDVNNSWF